MRSQHWTAGLSFTDIGRRTVLALIVSALAALGWVRSSTEPGSSDQRRLRSIGAIDPRISPDGTMIAVSYQGAIWRTSREGGTLRRLTKRAGFETEAAWSPDSSRIAHVNLSDSELHIMDAQTGSPVALPSRIRAGGKLFFHSDGKELLGNFSQGDGGFAFSRLNLATGEIRSLFDPPQRLQVFCLSSDGERIAYAISRDVDGEQSGNQGPQADLWVLPARGGHPQKLTRFPSRIFSLWWSGDNLYFSTDLGGAHNDLWTISISSSAKPQKLTSGQADEDTPSISSDGRWLAYTDNRNNATAIMVRDLTSGEEKTLPVSNLEFTEPTGTVQLTVSDKGTKGPLTARVSLRQQGGKYFAPLGSLYRMVGDLEHFYCSGQASITVPAGKYLLRVFRGLEYREQQKEFEVSLNGTSSVAVELERWVNPTQNSWYGGESHIHANYGYGQWYNTPETMRLQIEGEGLNVGNFMVANSDTDGVFDREFFRGAPDPASGGETVLYWNEEFRATLWGHMTLLNLKHLVEPLFTGFPDTTNPWDIPTNGDVADRTHLQGGHVNFTHPASNNADPFLSAYSAKSLPVDVALGKIDSLDINWNPGGQESYQPTLSLWYRLLNCGFRLPASAGTDCFLNRIRSRLPGSDRVYVKMDGAFAYTKWVQSLRAGRSFVTNGPILEFSGNGQSLGETLRFAAEGRVTIHATALSQFPLKQVELVYNGAVVAAGTLSQDHLKGNLDQEITVNRTGWMSFRALGDKGLQAHTSPIYVEVSDKPAASRTDAEYFLRWIDRLEAQLRERRRFPNRELQAQVESQLNAARAVYRRIISAS